MSYLSRQDLKNRRAEAVAGALFAPPQVIALLDEIDRLNAHIADMQADLDHHALMARVSDRRSEPREAVMARTLDNLSELAITVATANKEGV